MAVQRRAQVHRPLPRDARDLELRLRLRRQCAARQEVLRAAHRLGHGTRPGLARRAHADSGRHVARGREDLRRRRVPERLRQDELRDADSAARACEGWKVTTIGDDIAWIKPARRRPLLRDQSRGRVLRRRARAHRTRSNPNAMETLKANVIFTNVALTDDGDVWWEGMTRDAARAPHRLAGPSTGRRELGRHEPAGGTPERALHGRRRRSARRSTPSGTTRRACRSPRSSSAARRARHRCRSVVEATSWEDGVYKAATMGSETTALRPRARWDGAARSVRDAAVLRLPHRRLLPALARDGSSRCPHLPPHLQRQLVSHRRARASSPGLVSRQNMRVLKWIIERCQNRAHAAKARWPAARILQTWTGMDWTSVPIVSDASCASSAIGGSRELAATTSFSHDSRPKKPPRWQISASGWASNSRPDSGARRATDRLVDSL